ncbi:MAG TPA: hypothetical protein VG711_04515, partial [Phycisphaerales bacterium]|nr:hypothetical protein [Phycisphaerales bacterium]
ASPTWTGPALPNGVKPAMWVRMDFSKLQDLMHHIEDAGGHDAEGMLTMLKAMGFMGKDAGMIQAAAGYGVDRMHCVAVFTGARERMEKMGAMPSTMIRDQDLRLVPSDATYASISKFNPAAISRQIQEMTKMMQQGRHDGMGFDADDDADTQGEAPDLMKMIEEKTGINPQRDILDNLGETIGVYTSDSTGGGGWASLVTFVEVKNADGMKASLAKIMGMVNGLGKQMARGYVRMSEKKINDQSMYMIEFPGLPVPLELCLAMSGGYLFTAMTPQGMLAALDQTKAGKEGLMNNANFAEMGGEKAVGAMSVKFMDTPRMIRNGYGLMSLAMSALSNAVKQPNGDRTAGVVMPSYSEMTKGAKAMVNIASLEGGELVIRGQSDRSALVNGCGVVGAMGGMVGLYAIPLGAGLLIPAVAQARENALDLKSLIQLKSIAQAEMIYAADHEDSTPASVQELVDQDILTRDMLVSPAGHTGDGKGDYFIIADGRKMSDVVDPSRTILGYDRAMYLKGKKVAVVFYDGHAEQMDAWEFDELMQDEANQGVNFELPE